MRMRVTLVLTIVLAVLMSAVPMFAESNQAVENSFKTKEQAGWQAWKVIARPLWVKKGGKWMSPFHQETTAEGM
jgi:hypothetical protein